MKELEKIQEMGDRVENFQQSYNKRQKALLTLSAGI
jgi:hypothetical protein